MLPKIYPENYAMSGPDQRPIIMITYNKSTFFANDGQQKIQTLDGNAILQLKRKRKRIMVLDFLLL